MSNTIGIRFQVTTFGESHGSVVGAIVDGCPSRLPLSASDIQSQLDRRRPGQSVLTTSRNERDQVRILSGVDQGLTLGSPIALVVDNTDSRSVDYQAIQTIPRPSHADLTYRLKYGLTAASGGGRSGARETIGRVAAGAVAEKFLAVKFGVQIVAWVSAVGEREAPDMTGEAITRDQVDATAVRCPHAQTAREMAALIEAAKKDGDSVGGIIACVCRNVPPGWGEPVFDKLSALLARAMLSIPAAKGFEIGAGFAGARGRGSEQNDMFVLKEGRLGTRTNRSGGIQGGISNGEPLVFRVAFKPTATIAREQETVDYAGRPVKLRAQGRHDPCVLPRAVPIVEAMAALVLADCGIQNAECRM
ncbi:MAG: chorismate synthase [Kiritimatiellaeota bacterium]|nr:chorismate synthase [Kiritimatiellota bacterium]